MSSCVATGYLDGGAENEAKGMNRFQRLHPFTVLAVAAAVVTTTTAAGLWWLSCTVIACALIVAWIVGKSKKLIGLSSAIVLPTFASQLMIHGLASNGSFGLTQAGLQTAAELGLRTAVLVVVGLLCSLVIDRHQLVAAIDLSKAPAQLGYLVAATLFLLPQLADRQRVINEAQMLRQVKFRGGLRGWFQKVRLQAVPLVLSSLEETANRAPHLAARGFPATQRTTRLREVPDSKAQRRIRHVSVLCVLLLPALLLVPSWMDFA